MDEIRSHLEKLREESRELRREVRERTVGYIVAALGLVVGLAWNEAIKSLIEYLFPLSQNSVWAKFVYAFFLSVALVIATVALVRWAGKSLDERK